MLPKTYVTVYLDACARPDTGKDAFVSDWTMSSVWGEPSDDELTGISDTCGKLYDLAHGNVTDLSDIAGLSNRQFAARFGIPQRTMENWSTGVNDPPDYVKLLLAESVGYFS